MCRRALLSFSHFSAWSLIPLCTRASWIASRAASSDGGFPARALWPAARLHFHKNFQLLWDRLARKGESGSRGSCSSTVATLGFPALPHRSTPSAFSLLRIAPPR